MIRPLPTMLFVLFIMTILAVVGSPETPGWASLTVEDRTGAKPPLVEVPEVVLTGEEERELLAGGVVTRVLDGADGAKLGWMRFFADCDPVTAFWIITDNRCFATESDEYPATGSLRHRRRTFMPYTWENIECRVEGRTYVFQLLVFPLVSPRKTSALLRRDTAGLPWETTWRETDHPFCEDLADPALQGIRDRAVVLPRNRGSWRISFIPPEYRRSPQDLYRADCRYFVETGMGGAVGRIDLLVDGAQRRAMPTMAELVNHHGRTWREHMERRHTPEELAEYLRVRRSYLDAYREEFAAPGNR